MDQWLCQNGSIMRDTMLTRMVYGFLENRNNVGEKEEQTDGNVCSSFLLSLEGEDDKI